MIENVLCLCYTYDTEFLCKIALYFSLNGKIRKISNDFLYKF